MIAIPRSTDHPASRLRRPGNGVGLQLSKKVTIPSRLPSPLSDGEGYVFNAWPFMPFAPLPSPHPSPALFLWQALTGSELVHGASSCLMDVRGYGKKMKFNKKKLNQPGLVEVIVNAALERNGGPIEDITRPSCFFPSPHFFSFLFLFSFLPFLFSFSFFLRPSCFGPVVQHLSMIRFGWFPESRLHGRSQDYKLQLLLHRRQTH